MFERFIADLFPEAQGSPHRVLSARESLLSEIDHRHQIGMQANELLGSLQTEHVRPWGSASVQTPKLSTTMTLQASDATTRR